MSYCVGRAIEGISLNGLEYLLDDNGKILTFDSQNTAVTFLLEQGLSQAIIDDDIIIEKECDSE